MQLNMEDDPHETTPETLETPIETTPETDTENQ